MTSFTQAAEAETRNGYNPLLEGCGNTRVFLAPHGFSERGTR